MHAPPHPRPTRPAGAYLFSIDLEDIRSMVPGGERYQDRLRINTGRYLAFLSRHRARCTFFTTGDVAERHPDLIGEIAAAGHELACHTCDHVALHQRDPDDLRRDLDRNRELLLRAGAERVEGFRAPGFPLAPETGWAYDVLAELGFAYSSSVIPAAHYRGGWPGFGTDIRRMPQGVIEVPLTLGELPIPGFDLPVASGIYFRLTPFVWIRRCYRRTLARGEPVVGYLHPFDIDAEQERYPHPGLDGSRLLSALMFVNRRRVLPRLERLLALGGTILPYARYLEGLGMLETAARAPRAS